jgi:hypothetical protein
MISTSTIAILLLGWFKHQPATIRPNNSTHEFTKGRPHFWRGKVRVLEAFEPFLGKEGAYIAFVAEF